MARKTVQYHVKTEGRDKGKLFLLTEMPASQAEAWAARVLLALVKGNVDVPENFLDSGMAGIAQVGLKGLLGLEWAAAQPLLEEMMSCIQAIPTPSKLDVMRPLIEEDIEEVSTRLALRMEVFELHTGFSQAGVTFLVDNLRAKSAKPSATRTSPKS